MSQFVSSIPPMLKFKLVFLGDIYVGKTSLINRFMYDSFNVDYQATIGIDFLSKTIEVDEKTVRLQLWDTAGQERFRSLIPNYIRDSSVAIVMFDVSNRQTFANVDNWIADVKNERGDSSVILIVGNKIDKEEERCVTIEEARDKAKQFNASYLEISAKSGIGINEFTKVITQILPNIESRASLPIVKNEAIDIRNPSQNTAVAQSNKKECNC